MLAFCTVLCSCLGISVQTNITALVRLIAFLESWLCICHRFVYMYFSQTDSVFLSQILHISMWHHSGTGGRIRIFKRAKSIRIKFPKPWACCPTMEIICCSAGLVLAFQGLPEPDFQSPNLSLVLCLAGGTSSVELVHFLKGRQPEKFSGKDSQR